MVLKIFRAADAFLYLPTYVAEEYGIFQTLLKPLGVTKVEFITSKSGDVGAIELMLAENNNSEKSIAIVIGDPTAFLSKRLKNIEIENIRVIGAIIDKLPFWAVNHVDREFDTIKDFEKEFDTIIHYKSNLITGFYLGNRVKNEAKINAFEDVAFGNEIETLIKHNDNKGDKGTRAVAITADIVSLARGITNPKHSLKINYRFSKDGFHLTTGILTSKNCCDTYQNYLNKIVEAIQKSISMMYSSDIIANEICTRISKKPLFNSITLSPNEIDKIIELINQEQFYPANLNISEQGWTGAVKALSKTEQWESEDLNYELKTSFVKYIDNTFVLNSEKSIANQFGIDLDTFKKELLRDKTYAFFYFIRHCVRNFYNWVLYSSVKYILIFAFALLPVITGYLMYKNPTETMYSIIFGFSVGPIGSIIAAYIYDLKKKKDGK